MKKKIAQGLGRRLILHEVKPSAVLGLRPHQSPYSMSVAGL